MTARVVKRGRQLPARRLALVAKTLLDAAPLCALATISSGGQAYINTMYFARAEPWDIVWISAPDSQHSRNLRARSTAAIAVFDSHQRWGGSDRGIQVFGRARQLRGNAAREAFRAYGDRFKDDQAILRRFVAYRLRPTRLKLFDEREFGGGTFVSARVGRDGSLSWQRTEQYQDE